VIEKRGAAAEASATAGGESEAEAAWDEDDVMLFFSGNSRAVKQRP